MDEGRHLYVYLKCSTTEEVTGRVLIATEGKKVKVTIHLSSPFISLPHELRHGVFDPVTWDLPGQEGIMGSGEARTILDN